MGIMTRTTTHRIRNCIIWYFQLRGIISRLRKGNPRTTKIQLLNEQKIIRETHHDFDAHIFTLKLEVLM